MVLRPRSRNMALSLSADLQMAMRGKEVRVNHASLCGWPKNVLTLSHLLFKARRGRSLHVPGIAAHF
jgi:hypothetical protein